MLLVAKKEKCQVSAPVRQSGDVFSGNLNCPPRGVFELTPRDSRHRCRADCILSNILRATGNLSHGVNISATLAVARCWRRRKLRIKSGAAEMHKRGVDEVNNTVRMAMLHNVLPVCSLLAVAQNLVLSQELLSERDLLR